MGERNTARTIYAEALLGRLGGGVFDIHSAGRNPVDQISAHAIETLSQAGYDVANLKPKSWKTFEHYMSPNLDVIITLDDALKNGPFPIWYSNPVYVHWSFADPNKACVDDASCRETYRRLYGVMEQQILKMTGLKLQGLSPSDLRQKLQAIQPQ